MRLSFHGADRGVTGSCHLLEAGGVRVLVDCGLYQGEHELHEENDQPFGFEPADIDCVLLTHAHLDHCGRLPLLVRRGFRGRILTTAASRELARIVLLDAAHLNEEEAEHQARRGRRRGRRGEPPLYTTLDALNTLDFFHDSAVYGQAIPLDKHVTATFLDAGHILGSAWIRLDVEEKGRRRRLLFSGDLGNRGRPLLHDPAPPPEADYVLMETTYGDHCHKSVPDSVAELFAAINDTFARGGNVLIPTFALERAQELLFYLREGVRTQRLPAAMQVFLDSPMAISATGIFGRYPDCYNRGVAELFRRGEDPFDLPGLRFTRTPEASMAINRVRGGAVIMAGSGMCTGGRIRHHLKHNLWRADCSVVFVGFAAPGTLARRIIDGAHTVNLFGEPVRVNARIHTINGFSAHADREELLAWHAGTGRPRRTFLVHGDPERGMGAMATALEELGFKVECPRQGEEVELE